MNWHFARTSNHPEQCSDNFWRGRRDRPNRSTPQQAPTIWSAYFEALSISRGEPMNCSRYESDLQTDQRWLLSHRIARHNRVAKLQVMRGACESIDFLLHICILIVMSSLRRLTTHNTCDSVYGRDRVRICVASCLQTFSPWSFQYLICRYAHMWMHYRFYRNR